MNTEVQIIQKIAEHLGLQPEDVDREALLREDLGLGSLELSDLLSSLSQQFNVTFDSEEIENIRKVNDLIVLIEDNLID